jgi:hypothetical protein
MIQFERNVPRRVQQVVLVALDLSDEKFEVVGGLPALQNALGHDSSSSTRTAVAEAETWRLMRRFGGPHTRRLFVLVSRLYFDACKTPGCGRPARGSWCSSCMNAQRVDRQWQYRAIDLAVAGTSPATIASTLSRPLADIVRHLFSEVPDVIAPEWRQLLTENGLKTTSRERYRRHISRKRDEAQNDKEKTKT